MSIRWLEVWADAKWLAGVGAVLLTLATAGGCTTQPVVASPMPPVGRYVAVHSGVRVWRLDTSTGALCLMLAEDQAAFQTSTPCVY